MKAGETNRLQAGEEDRLCCWDSLEAVLERRIYFLHIHYCFIFHLSAAEKTFLNAVAILDFFLGVLKHT